MLYAYLATGTVVTKAQRLVILSAFTLTGKSQGDFAQEKGLNRSDLNRTINGRLVVDERYAEALNGLVSEVHPVRLEKLAA